MKFKLIIYFAFLTLLFSPLKANDKSNEISVYTGTFDIIDKEGDDQTNLFGIEHKNPNLFRDTYDL